MPRVSRHKSQGRSAEPMRCERCSQPIAKGEEYFQWAIKRQRGGVVKRQHVSHGSPRPSQLTESVMGQVYAAQESAQDAIDGAGVPSDCKDALEELKSEIESIRDEFQSNLDNMPEGLQQGDTGQLIQERIEGLEEYESELESASGEIEDDPEDSEEGDEEAATAVEDALQAAKDRASEAVDSLSL